MQSLSRLVLTAAAAAALACSGPSEPSSPLEGDFVILHPYVLTDGYAMGLSLDVNGTAVSGTGWLSGQWPVRLVTVAGELTGSDFDLVVTDSDGLQATLVGTATPSGIQGAFVLGPGIPPVPVTLLPVNPGSTGRFAATVTGDVSLQQSGAVGFGVNVLFTLSLGGTGAEYPLVRVDWIGSRPGPGTYVFDPLSGWWGNVYPPASPFPRVFNITGGVLRIFASTPYALIGRLEVQAEEAGSGETLTLIADFSAGCGAQTCI